MSLAKQGGLVFLTKSAPLKVPGQVKKEKKQNKEGERPGILSDAVPLNTANCTWQSPVSIRLASVLVQVLI